MRRWRRTRLPPDLPGRFQQFKGPRDPFLGRGQGAAGVEDLDRAVRHAGQAVLGDVHVAQAHRHAEIPINPLQLQGRGLGRCGGVHAVLPDAQGFRRAAFSNEAGIGSAAIAHSAVRTKEPITEGFVSLLEPFIDTVVICTMTALVMLTVEGTFTAGDEVVRHAWNSDLEGFAMTSGAFAAAFPFEIIGVPVGTLIASIALILFVFTTLLTWSYYGERAITFLYDRVKGSSRSGEKKLHMAWRVLWCVVIFLGAAQPSELVWRLGDISNAAMALPNLLALALLSGVVFKLAQGQKDAGPTHTADTPEEPEEY